MDMSLSKFWELVMDREAWHAVVHGVTRDWETELNRIDHKPIGLFLGSPVPRIHVSIFVPVLHWLDYCSFLL